MPHFHDVPTDASECQVVAMEKITKKGSINNTLEYTKASDWASTKFDVIVVILYKTEHKDQCANLLGITIKPLLEEMLNCDGFHTSTLRMILEAVTFKSTVPKKLTQNSTSIVHVSCPVSNCTFYAEMPKRVFHILPKSDGFRNHLNFGEDYKVHYNAECPTFPMTRIWYVGKFLQDLKTHYEAHHGDLVKRDELPFYLSPTFTSTLYSRGPSDYKIGHPPKSGDDKECV
eukprot:328450-Ditylum_brightwellii.AAC.1